MSDFPATPNFLAREYARALSSLNTINEMMFVSSRVGCIVLRPLSILPLPG